MLITNTSLHHFSKLQVRGLQEAPNGDPKPAALRILCELWCLICNLGDAFKRMKVSEHVRKNFIQKYYRYRWLRRMLIDSYPVLCLYGIV
jgi:hypothetical protein